MGDLDKLKCDYFDGVVKEFKDNLEYAKEEDVFCILREGISYTIYDIGNFYIIRNKKKYISADNANGLLQTSTIIAFFKRHKDIHYEFQVKTTSDLEDGIYYKGFKVSGL